MVLLLRKCAFPYIDARNVNGRMLGFGSLLVFLLSSVVAQGHERSVTALHLCAQLMRAHTQDTATLQKVVEQLRRDLDPNTGSGFSEFDANSTFPSELGTKLFKELEHDNCHFFFCTNDSPPPLFIPRG